MSNAPDFSPKGELPEIVTTYFKILPLVTAAVIVIGGCSDPEQARNQPRTKSATNEIQASKQGTSAPKFVPPSPDDFEELSLDQKGEKLPDVALKRPVTLGQLREAADKGDAEAQTTLGTLYYFGKPGVAEQDYKEAVGWFSKAAGQGNVEAQFELGRCFYFGNGVLIDYAEAFRWFRKSANQGNADAQFQIALCYINGQGVSQDYAEAVKWWKRAAAQGDPYAQLSLGVYFANKQGSPEDFVEAYNWFNLVLAQAKPIDCIALRGISQIGTNRFAVINGKMVAPGESASAKTLAGEVKFTCLAVSEKTAELKVGEEIYIRYVKPKAVRDLSDVFQEAFDARSHLEQRMTSFQIAEAQRRSSAFVTNSEVPTWEKSTPVRHAGTGFFVTDDGYLVTCEHVVHGAASFYIKSGTNSLRAELVTKNEKIDVALLKVDGLFQALPVAMVQQVKLGDGVFTIGFPNPSVQGVEPKLTRGEISSMAGIQDDPSYFQISVPVQPGNSGGALMDERGNVVGVVTMRLDDAATFETSGALPQNVNYAVKGNLVRAFLDGVPELRGKLKSPSAKKSPDAASGEAENAAVLVIAE